MAHPVRGKKIQKDTKRQQKTSRCKFSLFVEEKEMVTPYNKQSPLNSVRGLNIKENRVNN